MALSTQKSLSIRRKTVNIPAGATVDIDVNDLIDFVSLKYFIDMAIDSQNRFRSVEVNVSKQSTDVTDSAHSRLGNSINVALNFLKVGSTGVLRAVSSESVDVTLNYLKF